MLIKYKLKIQIQIISMLSQLPQQQPSDSLDKTIKVQDREDHSKSEEEESQENFVNYDEEIDNILDQRQEQVPRQQVILQFKNMQLQKICQTLTSANKKLLEKIEELQTELQMKGASQISQTVINQQYSQMNVDFTDIQTMIIEYRQQLTKYQQKIAREFQQKNKNIFEIESSLQMAKQALSDSQILNEELQSQVQALQLKNGDLVLQIQDISTKNQLDSRYNTPIQQYRTYAGGNNAYYEQNYEYGSSFNSTVQSQLEKLIQKLVKQLEYERGARKKITDQMKRMREDLIDSERQIANKNQRIYALEMGILKGPERTNLAKSNFASNFNQSPTQTKLKNSRSNVQIAKQAESQYSSNSRIDIIREKARNQVSRLNLIQDSGNVNSNTFQSNSTSIRNNLALAQRKDKQKYAQKQIQKQKDRLPISLKNKVLNKNLGNSPVNPDIINKNKITSQNEQSKSKKIMKSFTLFDLINEQVILTIVDKFVISIKLLDFFNRKINNKDYKMLMLEDILVCNYNKINTNLILIRKNTKTSEQKGKDKNFKSSQETAQSVLWNLGFILDNLLMQIQKPQQSLGDSKSQMAIVQQINNLLQDVKISISVLDRLKELFQQAIKGRGC